jgi:hypothetical protein
MGKLFIFDTSKPTTMKKAFLFSLLILVFASGCREMSSRRERGSGHITSQNREVSGFTNVDVSGAIDVYIKQDSTTSVKVEGDDNLLQYIEVYTDKSTLVIHTERGIRMRPSNKIKVYISNPSYKEFEISGASDITTENQITSSETLHVGLSGASGGKMELNSPRISVQVTGASNLTIRGKTKDFEVGGSGACEIKCFELLTENSSIELSGASSAEVYASVKLDGSVSGASSIKYKGNAATSISSSGASGVNKVD